MTYIVDIILIAIFALVVLISAKRGFFLSLFDLMRTFISFLAAKLISQTAAPTLYSSLIEKSAQNYLSSSLGNVGTTDYVTQAEQALNSIPESFNGIMQMLGIDKNAIIDKISSTDFGGDNLVESILNNVVQPIATALMQFIIFVVLVLVIGITLKILIKLLDKIIKKLPKVKKFNTSFGAVFGAFRGLLLIVVISMLLVSVASFISNDVFIQNINNSVIIKTVQNIFAAISGINV